MTVQALSEQFGYRVFCMPNGNRTVTGGYVGDLLSRVMGKVNSGDAWITIMSNVNVVAVAALADPACVILAENVMPDDGVLEKAIENGINLLGTSQNAFSACVSVSSAL